MACDLKVGDDCPILKLWAAQAEQQRLWHDAAQLDPDQRALLIKDLLLGAHEELAELQKATDRSRYHLLASARPADRERVIEEAVDTFKYIIAVLLTCGIQGCEWCEGFHAKTRTVAQRWEAEQVKLREGTLVFVTDLDGVLADFLGDPATQGMIGPVPEGDSAKAQAYLDHRRELYQTGALRKLKPIPGAADAIALIRELGVKVVVLTARPVREYPRLYLDTTDWLDEHGFQRDLLLFDHDKWDAITRRIAPATVIAAVDDMPREVWELSRHGVHTIMFDQPNNQGLADGSNIERARDWVDVLRIVARRAEQAIKDKYRKVEG